MTATGPPDTAALMAEVERLRLQIASLPGLVWTAIASGGVDFPGPQWPDYTGLPRERLYGAGWLEIVHPEDRLATFAAWESAVLHLSAFTIETRLRRHDGVYRWFAVRASPARDAKGVMHWFGSCTDIDTLTQSRKALDQAEAALRERQAELEIFFRQAATGLAVVDVQGRILRVNQRVCEILGYDEHEILGSTFPALTHPDDIEANLTLFRRLIDGEISEYTCEKRYRRKQGDWVWASLSVAMAHHEANTSPFIISVIQDIDTRKRLEAELQEAQQDLEARVAQRTTELEAAYVALVHERERSRLVLETATDAYVACDGHGTITDWNRAAERLFGWSHNEIIGHNLTDTIIPPHASQHHRLNLEQFRAGGNAAVFNHVLELSARHRDGHDFPVDISLAANHSEEGWIISVFLRDVSDRKRAEAALTQAILEAEEAREGAEASLQLAEAANRAKSDFLATMSHEIRTPLNGVIGFNGLLLDGPLGEHKRRYAELARQSGEALLHLLNDFLDFSKIEAGHLELEPVAFDLRPEIGHVLTLIATEAGAKDIALSHTLAAPAYLFGDAARLRQILLNLLSNAVKFTERGKVNLSCEEVLRTGTEVWICFQISDTGIGIDPSARDRLFQPFVQADTSTTRRFGGTGLGLAISKRLAEAMGGKIGFHSSPGQGSTFWVDLPFQPLTHDRIPPASSSDTLPPLPAGESRGRVLVVEDNPVSQLLATEIFRRLGCQVDVAGNGKEAVEAFRRLPYDLIFMDCDMPVMNGYDATCEIRTQAQAGEHVPIIAMTASVLQGDVERCISVGMDDFMSKPLRLQQIATMVDKWLRPLRHTRLAVITTPENDTVHFDNIVDAHASRTDTTPHPRDNADPSNIQLRSDHKSAGDPG